MARRGLVVPLDQFLVAAVQKTSGQPWQQAQTLVRLSQQDAPPSELIVPPSNRATISRLPLVSNPITRLVTLCHSEGRCFFGANCCVETQLCHEEAFCQ
jgi:hypothetical protein